MLAKVTVFCLLKIQINIISMNRNLNCEETSIHSFSTEDCNPRLWLQQLRKKYVWVSWGFLGHLVHFEFLILFEGYYCDNGRSSWLRKLPTEKSLLLLSIWKIDIFGVYLWCVMYNSTLLGCLIYSTSVSFHPCISYIDKYLWNFSQSSFIKTFYDFF